MISIELVFYLSVLLFGGIGAIRGWQKEVIAMAGLVGSIAFLQYFGYSLVRYGAPFITFLSSASEASAARQSFWVQFVFHIVIAFFSYQVIGSIATRAPGTRNERARTGFQNMFIGFVIGVFNGYLLIGALWSFLEYQITEAGYVLLADGQPYVFGNLVQRVVTETIFLNMIDYLPLSLFGSGVWLLFFFVSFFIVIIALV
ncbi:MAG: hypothetical protein ACI9EW_003567 [Cellvibrionaceae bacterium]|jgi:hypothetical protein